MLLFRSEEEIAQWCRSREIPVGGVVPVARLALMAADWYGDRLDPAWAPRSRDASQAILDSHGLTGGFWRLPG